MESRVVRTAHTFSRSCSGAVAEMCRSFGRPVPESVLQCRVSVDEGLDGRPPPDPGGSSAARPVVGSLLTGDVPPVIPKAQQSGADSPVSFSNAAATRKRAGSRVRIAVLGHQHTRTALNEEESVFDTPLRSSSSLAQACPTQGVVRGKELPVGSAYGARKTSVSKASAMLKHHRQQGAHLDSYTAVGVLKRCSNEEDLTAVMEVHDSMIQSGMSKNPYVANTLLSAYVKCGRLQDARRLFDGLEKKTVVTWNIMIGGYAKKDHTEDALEVFRQMRQGGGQPAGPLCLSVLNACASPSALKWGKEVHAYVKDAVLESDVRVGTAVVRMYAQCGCIREARRVFEELPHRDLITWNVMIGAYAKSGSGVEAHRLFLQMQREGFIPDASTYLSILNAAASAGALEWVKAVHSDALKTGLDSDPRVCNALVHMYAKSGSIDDARVLFDRLKARDVRTWTIMIGAYAESGCGAEAYRLLLQMQREGFKPDKYTYATILNASSSAGALEWIKEIHGHVRRAGFESDVRVSNALVHMYAKSGSIADARLVFDRMGSRDVTTWTILIGAYAESGCGVEAYKLFLQMTREGFIPDAITYLSILNPSASAGALGWVKEVHDHARRAGLESDLRVGSALVHMYAKGGSIGDAQLVFDRMERRDVVAWNAMMGGLGQHGYGHEALELFKRMNVEGVTPNESSFVAVLSACCHAGRVDDGHRLFSAMKQEFGIQPTVVHYTCIVDLLGRAGLLAEAKLFIDDMPIEPDAVTWKALLGACRTYVNVELGEFAAEEALKLEPKDASVYVALSNIYAAVGNWEKVSSVRTMMHKIGVRKEPGRSWIEVDSKIHEFVVGDTFHPEAKEIYAVLKQLNDKLKAEGYIPDTKLVLQNIHEEDKELALCSHSEKLAIGYGLLRIPHGKPIRVYKNLRVCSDCHTATKFISKVTGREIIARDANRFHHFKDGVCSCGDYW